MTDILHWRYSTKQFDPNQKLSDVLLNELLDVLRFSPSSFGLQPWKFIVIKDSALRQQLRPHTWNQAQITDASHLILLCSLKTMDEAYINTFIDDTAKTRGMDAASLNGYKQMMVGSLLNRSSNELNAWMKSQVYIALGMLLYASASKNIDACPIEGFDIDKINEILDLEKQNLEAVVFCPIGYRDSKDSHATLPKVRFAKDDKIIIR